MNKASGYPKFAKHTSYVKDSVMYVKCIVDTFKIFHRVQGKLRAY